VKGVQQQPCAAALGSGCSVGLLGLGLVHLCELHCTYVQQQPQLLP
jgi:hypothetical protein